MTLTQMQTDYDREISDFTLSIEETVPGSCIYEANNTCEAESTYKVTVDGSWGTPTYLWNIEGPADSFTGQGTDTLVVKTIGDSLIGFSATCLVMIGTGEQTISAYGEHPRTLADVDIAYYGEVV